MNDYLIWFRFLNNHDYCFKSKEANNHGNNKELKYSWEWRWKMNRGKIERITIFIGWFMGIQYEEDASNWDSLTLMNTLLFKINTIYCQYPEWRFRIYIFTPFNNSILIIVLNDSKRSDWKEKQNTSASLSTLDWSMHKKLTLNINKVLYIIKISQNLNLSMNINVCLMN